MSEIRFYHLTRNPLEQTLPGLLEKSLQRGWRVLVQTGVTERLAFLDQRLWQGADISFLPHGITGAEHSKDQPILLSDTSENLNDANVLMLVDGAISTPEIMDKFDLTCLFFDGNDETALTKARQDWKSVVAAKLQAVYWAQDADGRWLKKAESDPAAQS